MNWYYVDQGQQAGPVDDPQLEELRRSGKLQSDTLVWREGMANWAPYSEAKGDSEPGGLRPASRPATGAGEAETSIPPEAVCTECGGMFPTDNMIRYGNAHVCANCKPVFMQKLAEGAKINSGDMRYAGFWIRFAAKIVDGLILGLPFVVAFAFVVVSRGAAMRPGRSSQLQFDLVPLLLQLGFVFVQMAYQIFFVGKYGATPGKMACKLSIVTAEGGKVGYGRATGRFFAEMLSGMICYIGYIIAAFDSQKRSLHDHICNTRVVYK
jgi:uncharacterized RDD family membrane protein YckC